MLVSSLHYTPGRAGRWRWSYMYIWTCKILVSILWNTNERARRYQWWSSNKYTAELPSCWCRSHNIQLNVQEVGVDHTPYRWTWKRLVPILRYTDECARSCCRSYNKYIAERAIYIVVDLTIYSWTCKLLMSTLPYSPIVEPSSPLNCSLLEPILGPCNPDRGREVRHWIPEKTSHALETEAKGEKTRQKHDCRWRKRSQQGTWLHGGWGSKPDESRHREYGSLWYPGKSHRFGRWIAQALWSSRWDKWKRSRSPGQRLGGRP